jgi:membrane protease subunit HflK
VLAEFKRAPEVTRERLYIDTMQQVFSRTSKLMIDAKGGGNLLMLPLDKIMQQSAAPRGANNASGASALEIPLVPAPSTVVQGSTRESLRNRERGER